MGNVKLINRVKAPLSTIKLALNDTSALTSDQVSALYNFINPLTKKAFEIRNMDELFYQCNLCFDEDLSRNERKDLTEKICYAMGYLPSTENLLEIRDTANKYLSHNYFQSEENVGMLRKTVLPIMDAR